MSCELSILNVCSVSNGRSGGVDVIVPQYIAEYSKVTQTAVLNLNKNDPRKFDYIPCYFESWAFDKILNENRINLVIFHEIYYIEYPRLARLLVNKKIPYIIIPHGSLRQEAQEQKRFVKKALNKLMYNSFVSNAVFVQFLSGKEQEASVGFNSRYSISPNGVEEQSVFKDYSRYVLNDNGMKLVFIGRLSVFYKGLDLLAAACLILKEWMLDNGVSIDLYGVDFEGGIDYINTFIKNNDLNEVLRLNDPVYDKDKENVLLNADAFIQTSRSEGQPVGILEALSYGLVPLVTEGTTFAYELENYECGFSSKTDVDDIASMIVRAYENRKLFVSMSKKAIKLISEKYSWRRIIVNSIKEYEKIIRTTI